MYRWMEPKPAAARNVGTRRHQREYDAMRRSIEEMDARQVKARLQAAPYRVSDLCDPYQIRGGGPGFFGN